MKKIYSLLSLFIIALLLTGCTSSTTLLSDTTSKEIVTTSDEEGHNADDYVTLPDLTGKTREEIKAIFDELGLKLLLSFDSSRYYGPDEYDQFVKYGNKEAGDTVLKGSTIRVYTSQLELKTYDLSVLQFTRDATGKSFFTDSYGYVTWTHNYADGDTTTFIDNVTGETFTLRFLCVDTPEVDHGTRSIGDPWGDEAAKYTQSRLENAKEIIVESESDTMTCTEVYGRYLGYVWVDGSCLNLELIALAYSNYTGNERSSKYHSVFSTIEFEVSETGRRFYGEYDPNYKHYE